MIPVPRRFQNAFLLAVIALAGLTARSLAAENVPADRVLLVVKLPAAAKLVIGSSETNLTGGERSFLSPVIAADKDYEYELTATWSENGKSRTGTRKVTVRAGKKVVVDFNTPVPAAKHEPAAKPEPAVKNEPAPKPETPVSTEGPKSRTFLFTYGATVSGLMPGQTARIWLPVPDSTEDQEIKIEARDLPAEGKIAREPKYGNQVLYVEAKANAQGQVPLKMVYRVTRHEVKGDRGKNDDPQKVSQFLQPDALVPVSGKPLELIKDKPLPADEVEKGRLFYDVVNNHMRYSKEGTGWGRGDSVWACDSKYGNCSDFHSLFISLSRSQKIPAKFEMGFPVPEKRGSGEIGGYHCWAFFRPAGKGWVPVDISEANKNPKMKEYYFGNLTEDRVTFSVGRDLELVPKQDGPPVNFLIYPYVEVDGKVYPADKVQRSFAYEDVK